MAAGLHKKVTKEELLASVTHQLNEILEFLSTYLPLANAHASEFITKQHWNTLLPDTIQSELLSFTNDQLSSLPLHAACNYIRTGVLEKVRHKTTSGITDDLDQNITFPHVTQNVTGIDQFKEDRTKTVEVRVEDAESKRVSVVWRHKSISDFCEGAFRCSIDGSGLSVGVDDVINAFSGDQLDRHVFVKSFMNDKKAHEVEVMSGVCAFVAAVTECEIVVDFGSGKGYLGNSLYLQHNLAVMGIDAVPTNSLAAGNRRNILQKQWHGLTLNAQLESQPKQCTKKEKKKLKHAQLNKYVHGDKKQIVGMSECNVSDFSKCSVTSASQSACRSTSNTLSLTNNSSKNLFYPPCYIPITLFINKNTDLSAVARQQMAINRHTRSKAICNEIHTTCTRPVCEQLKEHSMEHLALHEVTEKAANVTSPDEQLNPAFTEADVTDSHRMLLTGLHTCGNLAGTTLEIFVNNPDIVAVCGVGCCYHLVDERFASMPEVSDNDALYTFPMSKYLQERHVSLGRNARNLASQSVSRVPTFSQLQGERFFPRALLQTIIAEQVGLTNVEWKGLRKLERKCAGTKDYIRRACRKLGVGDETVTDEMIEDYMEKYADDCRKLAAFFQLRTVLAPCIEAAVLLDRVCYLLEQESVDTVLLVKLFDPVLSPRCYGIVASKNMSRNVSGQ